MDTPIARAEHEEFCRRIDEENHRQNRRLETLEQNVERMGALTSAVEKLATNMENMLKEQERQGKRLETLENRDGEMWRKVIGYIASCVVGILVGFLFKQLGM